MTKKFYELGLPNEALRAVDDLGYELPTEVQERAIPAVLKGRDVIAAAKTGTGKTAAFCLPTISTLPHKRPGLGPTMLILTPTRELAMQIEEVARTISKRTYKRVVCLLGGVSYEPQRKALAKGCDVLVATPGRLIDLLNQDALTLKHVTTLVLDEADRMLDMGFLPDVRRIVNQCPENSERQTLLFSATIDKNIEKNLMHLLDDPEYVEIAHRGETADLVKEYSVEVAHRSKPDLLLAVLEEYGSERVIVFARTKYRVDTCVRKLRKAGYKVAAIHGDRSQSQRKTALADFAEGKTDILVATDILARGIDINEIPYIVNFDMPHMPEDYVHRIGRTGRAGEEGLAISFITPENAQELRGITKLIGHEIPVIEIPGFDAAASAQAIADKATRQAARKDPEIDAVMRQMKRERKKEASGEKPQEAKPAKKAKKKKVKDPIPAEPQEKTPHRGKKHPNRKGKPRKKQEMGERVVEEAPRTHEAQNAEPRRDGHTGRNDDRRGSGNRKAKGAKTQRDLNFYGNRPERKKRTPGAYDEAEEFGGRRRSDRPKRSFADNEGPRNGRKPSGKRSGAPRKGKPGSGNRSGKPNGRTGHPSGNRKSASQGRKGPQSAGKRQTGRGGNKGRR